MGMELRVVMVMAMVIALTSVASAASGTATYYTAPYVPSACYGYEDEGTMIAAASDVVWNNGAACGTYYTVTCTGPTNQGVLQPCYGNSVTVKIVDYCPSGCQGTIDLSQEAFATIADLNAGKIYIDYY
ncbi:EG45-like domain containing protein [Telopea speciosissima]|uniref:EG45-like domain containing protein n=1 Tax=Telopea speciosissima TaxID=54955 RepID=UPI001CC39C6F|nr:EG45-like domain containing protein [Telopea speciosissima]XP_043708661.1 EG45-like domain containing protein [Telopea speciosissima]XP_043711807.1 EG45-like domain containing protein [Telopea speciosissima]